MTGFIRGWADGVLRFRWLVILMALVLTGLSFVPMKNLYFDSSNERFFLKDDPNYLAFQNMLELFGDNEYLSIGVVASGDNQDLFQAETLDLIEEITVFLEEQEMVTQVRSLTRYQYTHDDDGLLATDYLIEEFDDEFAQEQARSIIVNEPLALGTLITEDLKHTRVVGRVEYKSDTAEHKVELVNRTYDFISQPQFQNSNLEFHFSGQPVFSHEFETVTQSDSSVLNPAMALLMIVILYISFRSISAMLLPWVVIGTGIILTTGIQGLMVWPHSVVESALVPTLIIIGVGVSVHVLVEFYHFRSSGQNPKDAAHSAITHLWLPAFFTAFTTAAGFIALSVTKLVPVQQFAYLGAIGAMVLFLLALTLLPAVLSFVPWFSQRTKNTVENGLITKFTKLIPAWTKKFRVTLASIGLMLLLGGLYVIPGISVDSNFITYFKEENQVRKDLNYFDQHYGGINIVEMIVDSGEEDGVKNPQFLKRVEELQAWMEAQPEAGNANSLVDFVKEISESVNEENPDYRVIPETSNEVAQYLFLYENTGPDEDLSDLRDFDNQYLRISVPVLNMPATETSVFLHRVESQLLKHFPDLTVELTGNMVMYHVQDEYINEGMIQSFLLALTVIGISFIILFRSLKYGLVALVPSVVPVLLTGAILAITGVPLNLGTMIVGAMTMGIAVDDAIHVVNRYLFAKKLGLNTYDSIYRAMSEAGRAVVFTSVVLVTGFSVMLFGSFIPYIYTGLFAATILGLALIGDLVFLPAILHILDGKKKSENIETNSSALNAG